MFQTDDPQFDALRAQHQTRYGVSIAFIKSRVEPGTEYANEVARAVVSPNGGYFELAEMPEEFAGALGSSVSHRLVAPSEALETMRRLERLAVAVIRGDIAPRALSLYVLYAGGSLRRRQEMFVLDAKRGEPFFAHGGLQAGVVPRFFKMRLDAGDDEVALESLGPGRRHPFPADPQPHRQRPLPARRLHPPARHPGPQRPPHSRGNELALLFQDYSSFDIH